MALAPASPPPFAPPLAPPLHPGGCECSADSLFDGAPINVFPLFDECHWSKAGLVIWYFFLMCYFFHAVGIVANIFMEAIEVITSKEKTIKNPKTGDMQVINVWNPTVANLTLMALGSSAPEILLAVLEVIVTNKFHSGELGPGTIVGSAAFNLLFIIAICVAAIPNGQLRRIEQLGVFITTSICSIFAYLWLYFVLRVSSVDLIDIWEAVLTFLFFPLLVGVAYAVDKGYHLQLGKRRIAPTQDGVGGVAGVSGWVTKGIAQPTALGVAEAVSLVKALRSSKGDPNMTEDEIKDLAVALKPKTQSEMRKEAMKFGQFTRRGSAVHAKLSPEAIAHARASVFNKQVLYEEEDDDYDVPDGASLEMPVVFESRFYRVSERDGHVVVKALLLGTHAESVTVAYMTRDGQGANAAKANSDYTPVEGLLVFAPGEKRKEITIPIIDDDDPEPDEDFELALADPKATAAAGNDPKKAAFDWDVGRACKVLIIDDDRPGVLRWQDEEIVFEGGAREVSLSVYRYNGNKGDLKVRIVTEPAGAEAEKDFTPIDETFLLGNTVCDLLVTVPITTTTADKGEKAFKVKLVQLDGAGAGEVDPKFSEAVVRLRGNALAASEEEVYAAKVAEIINATLVESDQPRTYADQFRAVLRPEGDSPSVSDWCFHIVEAPWKLVFASVPPPSWGGGWPCFFCALLEIGVVTFFISEIATIFGCVIGMAKACNAVVFVALGTSLPDALASKTAALNDLTADASVGNVTGSNCVNVFLGLGLPWLVAACYWKAMGATDDWKARYPKQALMYPDGGFVVVGDDLGFAVVIFVSFACICFLVLFLRRTYCGGELGGPPVAKQLTAFFFVGLWIAFVTMYCALGGSVVI